jgi:hypothetical protein
LSATEYDQWHEDNEYKVLDRASVYGGEASKLRELRRSKLKEEKAIKESNQSDHVHKKMEVFNDAAAYAESLKHTHRHNHQHNHIHEHKPNQIHTKSSTMTKTHTHTEYEEKPHYHSHTQSITTTYTKGYKNDQYNGKPQKGNPPFW